MSCPRITVVTPSFNQGRYLEASIRSVLEQDYPDLQYVVIDGGSTDDSVDIIRRFENSIDYWESQPDGGQSHALNKGFSRATGDVLCWLNADDCFSPSALTYVGDFFESRPRVQWLVGGCRIVSNDGGELGTYDPRCEGHESLLRFWEGRAMLPQPSSFWRRELMADVALREDLHYALDHDLWLKFSQRTMPVIVSRTLADYRMHDDTKTSTCADAFLKESLRVCRPQWWRKGITYALRCEAGWRNWRSEKLFRRAFDLKHQGRSAASRSMLGKALLCQPCRCLDLRYINLLARLTVGDSAVGRLLGRSGGDP